MTRKRFVNRMMGLGYSRNEANALAARARRYGESYAARMEYELSADGHQVRACWMVRKAAEKAAKALRRFRRKIYHAAAATRKAAATIGHVLRPAILLDPGHYGIPKCKLDPAGNEPEPVPMWPKENPHLRITDVSLVASGGVPLNYGQNCDGLRIHHSFVDEVASLPPALTQEQIDARTAKWPGGTAVLVGIDLADGPDVAAQIHVAGGAENAD